MPVLTNMTRLFRGTREFSAAHRQHEDWPASAEFDPSAISGLKIWLDAADYSSGAWPNKATGGVSTGFVGSPNPTVSVNTKNGHPLVRFTTSEGRLRIASGTGVHLEWTVLYVARMVAGGYNAGRVLDAIYAPNNLLIGFWNGFEDVFYDNGFSSPDTRASVTTNWKLYSADGTASGPLDRCFSNGVLMGTITTGQGWGNTFAISGYDPSNAAESCDCEVAEVVQYNRRLTGAERQQVEGYLREKYALPTP